MAEQHLPDGTRSLDQQRPHSARVWDYWLGGKSNYEVDRVTGDQLQEAVPDVVEAARADRGFLMRSVRHLTAEAGIRQFLDLGAGLPTNHNTHEVAQDIAPESRVVYVDNDPLVLVHARALLTSTTEGACSYLDADVRDPGAILQAASDTLDFDQPIGLMMLGILGQLPDDDEAQSIAGQLLDGLPSGSYLALSDGTDTDEALNAAIAAYNAGSASSYHLRSPERIAAFFDGLELIEPGVVMTSEWRLAPGAIGTPAEVDAVCGIGRKP